MLFRVKHLSVIILRFCEIWPRPSRKAFPRVSYTIALTIEYFRLMQEFAFAGNCKELPLGVLRNQQCDPLLRFAQP
jgi:hypothetical protein